MKSRRLPLFWKFALPSTRMTTGSDRGSTRKTEGTGVADMERVRTGSLRRDADGHPHVSRTGGIAAG
jgi:hypothetical protein